MHMGECVCAFRSVGFLIKLWIMHTQLSRFLWTKQHFLCIPCLSTVYSNTSGHKVWKRWWRNWRPNLHTHISATLSFQTLFVKVFERSEIAFPKSSWPNIKRICLAHICCFCFYQPLGWSIYFACNLLCVNKLRFW